MASSRRNFLLIAGNGFVGARVSARLASDGHNVLVFHTGARPLPDAPSIRGATSDASGPPVLNFPPELFDAEISTAIHFLCMGAQDARRFVERFDGKARRLVLISSCDVYRAYGRFIGTEPGPPEPTPIDETAPLRTRLFPYRAKAESRNRLEYWYEKIEAERAFAAAERSESMILRLPKVFGPGGNESLSTIYGFAQQPTWRWTHGFVDNVAAAIALAALHPDAAGEIFNIGEAQTPTIGERLARLPPRSDIEPTKNDYDFRQDLSFDTSKIRRRLKFAEPADETEAMKALAALAAGCRK